MPQNKWLSYYARNFITVEVNNSFYRLPKQETFKNWAASTPKDFVFTVKANRYITHMKKLTDAGAAVQKLLDHAGGLGNKLGPVLFQLPANWHLNLERFSDFTAMLPSGYRYAFEFRDESWLTGDVYERLKRKGLALCISDAPAWRTAFEVTAPFAYIRLHGGKILYGSEYSEDELHSWAQTIEGFLHRQLEVFVYFNNDANAFAVKNALRLKELLSP